MSLLKIKAEVWVYPGLGGWHFVTLDKDFSAKIREKYKTGFVKIEARIGKTSWNTSLFPHKLSKSYLLCIKSSVRKTESIFVGDKIDVQIRLI
jgi:hypothetical protein